MKWSVLLAPLLVASLAASGCDIVTADLKSVETAEWHKTYTVEANTRVEINNVNGKVIVEPSGGSTVDVTAVKKARGASPEAAKQALARVTIAEDVGAGRIRIETKTQRTEGISLGSSSPEVEYHVKVPAGIEGKFVTVNGGVEISGLEGRITAQTTNGGVTARNIGGDLQASTTNGGLDIDLSKMPAGGVKLECTNGGIQVRLPRDAKATIAASIANGGISTSNLSVEATAENNRRRFEGRLNGGGPRLDIDGVNGGIEIAGR